jgi:hypothetical protein
MTEKLPSSLRPPVPVSRRLYRYEVFALPGGQKLACLEGELQWGFLPRPNYPVIWCGWATDAIAALDAAPDPDSVLSAPDQMNALRCGWEPKVSRG